MSPFVAPDRVYVSSRPQDMRCGVQRLAAEVASSLGGDPADGSLWCFVSRDCTKAKLLRYDANGWVLYYCRLSRGAFRWRVPPGSAPVLDFDRRRLQWLLDGLDPTAPEAIPRPPGRAVI